MAVLTIIMDVIVDFNYTNFTGDGILRVATLAYTNIFANMFWGILLGFVGAGIHANKRSLLTTGTYLVLVGIFFSILFPHELALLFGLLLAFMFTTILYNAFVRKKR